MPTSNDGDPCPPALPRRPAFFHLPRRRRMAVVRLGSRRGWRWRGRRLLAGLLRRLRLRCLAAKYRAALRRLRACHAALVRDLMEGAASIEAVQSRLSMESYFAAPFFPVTTVQSRPGTGILQRDVVLAVAPKEEVSDRQTDDDSDEDAGVERHDREHKEVPDRGVDAEKERGDKPDGRTEAEGMGMSEDQIDDGRGEGLDLVMFLKQTRHNDLLAACTPLPDAVISLPSSNQLFHIAVALPLRSPLSLLLSPSTTACSPRSRSCHCYCPTSPSALLSCCYRPLLVEPNTSIVAPSVACNPCSLTVLCCNLRLYYFFPPLFPVAIITVVAIPTSSLPSSFPLLLLPFLAATDPATATSLKFFILLRWPYPLLLLFVTQSCPILLLHSLVAIVLYLSYRSQPHPPLRSLNPQSQA
ncbi:hypothetical protein B296_00030015 [Ensete ventricosum]|uniref:Uncharacterized protein n=1 Tax=Ensete ventricosum TaxID=4639 RepID=A0A426YQS9_ENSVE|nr:hypothetical protein B296_00030015 [Ensete ventricosum]